MDMTLSRAYESAVGANPVYTDNISRWQFLYDSYVGGQTYRNGGYLTKYQLESAGEYANRLATTPLDNHCRSIIATYVSFLFRQEPERELGTLATDPTIEAFMHDCDWDGRSLDSFMKQATIWANVFGHTWMILSKPSTGAVTRADEMAMNVRPYLNLLSPLTVTDWTWTRKINGAYELTKFKYIEDVNGDTQVIREWTKTSITTYHANTKDSTLTALTEEVNELGHIPAVVLYANTSTIRGIGLSTIEDIADAQRFIYNMTSEAEQAVRLGSHPSLVKTEATQAGAGAGSVIHMPEHMDPQLKPYVLEFSGQDVASIYTAIKQTIESVDKMANTGSIRATETAVMSGVSREVEFQLLNARLSEMADNIELAEEQIWEFYAAYQGLVWDGEIEYPDSFSIRDAESDLDQLVKAQSIVTDPLARQLIEHEVLEIVGVELEVAESEEHPTTLPENRQAHIQGMIMEGYEDSEILEIHPEITREDIIAAKTALLNQSN